MAYTPASTMMPTKRLTATLMIHSSPVIAPFISTPQRWCGRAQIRPLEGGHECVGGVPFGCDTTVFHHHDMIGDGERHGGILFGEHEGTGSFVAESHQKIGDCIDQRR